jgi:hypothetical protein
MIDRRFALPFLLGALLLPAAPGTGAQEAEEKKDPANWQEAMAAVEPVVTSVRDTPPPRPDSKEYRDIAKTVRGALDVLEKHSRTGGTKPEFRRLWNAAVSAGHFHSVKGLPAYLVDTVTMDLQPVAFDLPSKAGWVFIPLLPQRNDQLWGEIRRTDDGGRIFRKFKFWVYLHNTVYSGVGGENAKGMAEMMLDSDKAVLKKVHSRSNRIVTARLSKAFPKTSYYEVIGEDEETGPVRLRNYYVKGAYMTYCFEVIEHRRVEEGDDAYTRWQAEGDCPELAAVMESLREAKKK